MKSKDIPSFTDQPFDQNSPLLDKILSGFEADEEHFNKQFAEQLEELKAIGKAIEREIGHGALSDNVDNPDSTRGQLDDEHILTQAETPAHHLKAPDKDIRSSRKLARRAIPVATAAAEVSQPTDSTSTISPPTPVEQTHRSKPRRTTSPPHTAERTQEHTDLPFEAFAKRVEPDEVVRSKGNDKPLNPAFLEAQEKARHLFVDAIADGSLYASPEQFANYLQDAHRQTAASTRVDKNKSNLRDEEKGQFRSKDLDDGHNKDAARKVAAIASKYSDPYADRFNSLDQALPYSPKLDGINPRFRPIDIVFGDGEYSFVFPPAEATSQYMDRATQLGKAIQKELHNPTRPKEEVLKLIGLQFEYMVAGRPFPGPEIPLFMNLANAQLKLFGERGISYGDLGHAAERLQPAYFAQYFADRASNKAE